MDAESAIEIRDLTRDYGRTRALDRVSFSVGRGEVFGYVGANGAGKTTTIKIMTGLLKPSAGDAVVCGHSVLAEPLQVKARIGYISESGALYEKLSPREFLTAMGRLYRMPPEVIDEQTGAWLAWFDLLNRADQRISSLSKGNKQRVCWIAALLHNPEVLILDEPLSGLDPEMVARVKDLMKEFSASGRTIFYSSHIIDVVEKVCTRVGVLHRGHLIHVGTVEEITDFFGAASLEEALMKLWQDETARRASGEGMYA